MTHSTIASTLICAALAVAPGLLPADCPEGSRPTTEAEQQSYIANMVALRSNLPPAGAGWELQPGKAIPGAPNSVCKGVQLVAAYDAVYVSSEQRKLNEERNRQYESRIEALRQLSPEEKRQADDLYRQGSQLGYKAIAELKNKNQAEADRLRTEANKAYAASRAIQTAHLEKVFPQIRALLDEQRSAFVSPEVKAHLIMRDRTKELKASGATPLNIQGAGAAWLTPDKSVVLSSASAPDGQPIWVQLEGDSRNMQTVAVFFAHPALARANPVFPAHKNAN